MSKVNLPTVHGLTQTMVQPKELVFSVVFREDERERIQQDGKTTPPKNINKTDKQTTKQTAVVTLT